MSSAADIGYLVGALVGLLIVLGLLVGGILLVVSARKSARAARQQANDPYSGGPPVSRGTGKLVGGIVMIHFPLWTPLRNSDGHWGSASKLKDS